MSRSDLVLPSSLATRSDLQRVIAEIERIDNSLNSAQIHEQIGHPADDSLTTSKQLADLLQINDIDIKNGEDRSRLLHDARHLKNTAPVIHVTFATSADNDELTKIIDWVRQSVHPMAVLAVGLQPSLIGGVYIRTTNKVFDFSIRSQMANGRHIIKRELEALSGAI